MKKQMILIVLGMGFFTSGAMAGRGQDCLHKCDADYQKCNKQNATDSHKGERCMGSFRECFNECNR